MKNYCISVVMILSFTCLVASCSKEKKIQSVSTPLSKSQVVVPTTEKIFVYQEKEYTILFDENGNFIPTEESTLLENLVANETDLTGFSFLGIEGHKTYLFSSEMAGYRYYEENIDQEVGRKFQVGHAINTLRDQLMQEYGANINYSNPQIFAKVKAEIEHIYRDFKIASNPPKDIVSLMGEVKKNVAKSTNNNSWQLWEDAIQNGEVFDMETEANVWSWVHGDWDCNITYAAMSLDWNYRQNGQSWNDCISSFCFNYQPGADAMAFAIYKDGFLNQGTCKKTIFTIKKNEWYNGFFIPCQNDLTSLSYGGLLCSNLNDNISSLRMQTVWEGCPVSFIDL